MNYDTMTAEGQLATIWPKRQDRRIIGHWPSRIRWNEEEHQAPCLDLSRGGARLALGGIPVGAMFPLFVQAESAGDEIVALAEVRWSAAGSTGLRFVSVEAISARRLTALVTKPDTSDTRTTMRMTRWWWRFLAWLPQRRGR